MARRGIAFLMMVATVGLAGCGFAPLYAGGAVSPGLASIEVKAPDGRAAYLLQERLNDALAREPGAPAAYQLDYDLEELRVPRGLGRDNAASRYELNLRVAWRLTEIASGRQVTAGQTDVLTSYGAASDPYAGIAAQQDGQERAAAEVARRIRLELARYFADQAG